MHAVYPSHPQIASTYEDFFSTLLVNSLSLEVTRQADRIRRRSHGQDWPGAASAMGELEEAVEILGRLVNTTLHRAIAAGRSEHQPGTADEEPPAELPAGQYL